MGNWYLKSSSSKNQKKHLSIEDNNYGNKLEIYDNNGPQNKRFMRFKIGTSEYFVQSMQLNFLILSFIADKIVQILTENRLSFSGWIWI